MSPVPAAALLASLAAVSLIADRGLVVALIAGGLFLVCLTAPRSRRWLYISGTLISALSVFLISPLVSHVGTHVIWEGPQIPVIGYLDVTSEEIAAAGIQALRLAAVGLAFAAYVLLLDLDRLLQSAGFARRSVLAVGLATRLVPTLERDAVRRRRGSARARRAGRGRPRPREAAVAGGRGLAGARADPGRGDGDARLRASGAGPGRRDRRGRASTVSGSWRRCSSLWGRCGSSAGRPAHLRLSRSYRLRLSLTSPCGSSRAR